MIEPPASGQRRRVSDRATRELERLWRPVSMAVRRLVPVNDPEHEDLVRTALACVVAALAVRPPLASYSERWLVAVARDVTFNRIQQRARETSAPPLDRHAIIAAATADIAAEPETIKKQVQERVRRLALGLGRVGRRSAVMVIQHDVLGQELEDLAEEMGISLTRAQWRLVRGRRALLEQLRRGMKEE